MNQFAGGSSAIKCSRITFLQDDHAASLDAWIGRVDGCRYEIRESNIRDEPAPFFDMQDWLVSRIPRFHTELAIQHARVYANVGNRFGQAKGSAPRSALFSRLRRSRKSHVVISLFGRTALVDRRQRETSCKTSRCRSAIYPSQFECNQSERQILWSGNETALFRFHENCRDSRFIEVLQQFRLLLSPFMRIAASGSDQPCHGTTRNSAH